MLQKLCRLAFICGLTLFIALMIWPYHDGAFRFGLPLSILTLWSTSLIFLWKRLLPRTILIILPLLALLPFALPGKPIDPNQLRDHYVAAMKHYEGTRYLWGGEGSRGIDCSGLPRRGLRDALLEEGIHHGNGAAFREWAGQWWFDASAKALGENYRGVTRSLGIKGKLRTLDTSRLAPGDLGITIDGRHVMIFLAPGEWIQADPGVWKVAIGHPATDPNPWFDAEVSMQRWVLLK